MTAPIFIIRHEIAFTPEVAILLADLAKRMDATASPRAELPVAVDRTDEILKSVADARCALTNASARIVCVIEELRAMTAAQLLLVQPGQQDTSAGAAPGGVRPHAGSDGESLGHARQSAAGEASAQTQAELPNTAGKAEPETASASTDQRLPVPAESPQKAVHARRYSPQEDARILAVQFKELPALAEQLGRTAFGVMQRRKMLKRTGQPATTPAAAIAEPKPAPRSAPYVAPSFVAQRKPIEATQEKPRPSDALRSGYKRWPSSDLTFADLQVAARELGIVYRGRHDLDTLNGRRLAIGLPALREKRA